jgi:hypothetical protein
MAELLSTLSYAPPPLRGRVRVEPAPGGAVLVLPTQTPGSDFVLLLISAGSFAWYALSFEAWMGWPGLFLPAMAAIGMAMFGWGVWRNLAGLAPEQRVRVPAATRFLKRSWPTRVVVRRAWPSWDLRPRWALRVTTGKGWHANVMYYTVARHRAAAERLAGELHALLESELTREPQSLVLIGPSAG